MIDIINPANIEGVSQDTNHFFTVYSRKTKWVVNENDKIILSELNGYCAQVDSEISFDDFKWKIKGIILDSQITNL